MYLIYIQFQIVMSYKFKSHDKSFSHENNIYLCLSTPE